MIPDKTEQVILQPVPVETVDLIRSRVPLEPNAPPPQPSDSSRNPNDAQRPPRAKYDPPYIMGSTTTGSGTFTADPFTWGDTSRAAQLGPWGGDAPPASPLTLRTDTWHRDRPPRDAAGRRTWGVKCDLIRIYEEAQGTTPETYVTYIFERQAVFDAQGTPVYITGEEWINAGGVAEKTLTEPVNRHPFEGYWTKKSPYKTDALDIFIAHGTVCRGDERFGGTAITANSVGQTLASIWTLSSQYPLIYIKCIFYDDGGIYACTLEQLNIARSICYEYDSGTSRHTWWHPILRYCPIVNGFNSKNSPFPDSGMERPIGGMAGWTILQLTNTNLVGQQQCMTDGASPAVTRMGWKLVPGPGATTGAGAGT